MEGRLRQWRSLPCLGNKEWPKGRKVQEIIGNSQACHFSAIPPPPPPPPPPSPPTSLCIKMMTKLLISWKFSFYQTIHSQSSNSTESEGLDSLSRRYSQDLMKAHAFDVLKEQLNKAEEVRIRPGWGEHRG
jgi:hypothetical protein